VPAEVAAARLRVQAAALAAAQVEAQTGVLAAGLGLVLRADLVAAPVAPQVEAQVVLVKERVADLAVARPVVQAETLVEVRVEDQAPVSAAGLEPVLRAALVERQLVPAQLLALVQGEGLEVHLVAARVAAGRADLVLGPAEIPVAAQAVTAG